MRISDFELKVDLVGLKTFKMSDLGDVVLLAGSNGSGKSRLLKLLAARIGQEQGDNGNRLDLDVSELREQVNLVFRDQNGMEYEDGVHRVSLINYSHYDIPLQSPVNFPPYVISKAKKNLERCDFEETARDVLLYIQYLAKYCKEEDHKSKFDDFRIFLENLSGIKLSKSKTGDPLLFGRKLQDAQLSPGQQYLLRMCVALYCNKIKDDYFIMFLDEPETHLHPDAIWNIMEKIKERFGNGQIWIATHSVSLLSMFEPSAIWYMKQGDKIRRVGSRSAALMQGLLGDEIRRSRLWQFISSPDWFACNTFAIECMIYPESKAVRQGDPQIQLVNDTVEACSGKNTEGKTVIVDYGAGKGRMAEGIYLDYPQLLGNIDYYAFNKFSDDSAVCRACMDQCGIDSETYYFEDEKKLIEAVGGQVKMVFLVNVLHEIHPLDWPEIFTVINQMLREDGELVIVELDEFTYGEKPYDSGFLVLQPEAARLLGGGETVIFDRHPERKQIIRYRIKKSTLECADRNMVLQMVKKIGDAALIRIRGIRRKNPGENINYQQLSIEGVKMAFWTQQFTDANLILEDSKSESCAEKPYHSEENHDAGTTK